MGIYQVFIIVFQGKHVQTFKQEVRKSDGNAGARERNKSFVMFCFCFRVFWNILSCSQQNSLNWKEMRVNHMLLLVSNDTAETRNFVWGCGQSI